MKTKISKKASTVVPAALRKRYGINAGDYLEWIDDGEVIKVIPILADPITALRGSAKGEKLAKRLAAARREDGTFE